MKTMFRGVWVSFIAFHLAAAEGEWLTDLAKAQAQAPAEKKMVFMDFTGSDWCPPCKALHKNVLTSSEFLNYAKENLVLLVVDFPRSKPQSEALRAANEELANKFAVDSFPTIIVLHANGKKLSKESGYNGSNAKEFVANLKKLKVK
jgi:thioredoxin-related protein